MHTTCCSVHAPCIYALGQPEVHGSFFHSLAAPKQHDVECQHSLHPAPAPTHPQSPPVTPCTPRLFLPQFPSVARCLGPQHLPLALAADYQTSCSTWLVLVCGGKALDACVYPAATLHVAGCHTHTSSHCGIGVCQPCWGYTCIASCHSCCRNDTPMLLGRLAGASASVPSSQAKKES